MTSASASFKFQARHYLQRSDMNPILASRFEKIEALLDKRKKLNDNLPRDIGLWAGAGAIGAFAIIGLTGGAAIAAMPAVIGAMQATKGATKLAMYAAQNHKKEQNAIDSSIEREIRSMMRDVTNQLSSGQLSKEEAIDAYYRLKYMDKSFAEDISELASHLGVS